MVSAEGGGRGEGLIPRVSPDWSPDGRDLSAVEGFLLSRIDGKTPWEQLRQIGGLPPEEVDRHLHRWLDEGILVAGTLADNEPISPSDADRLGSEMPAADPEAAIDPNLEISTDLQRRILQYEANLDRSYHELLGVARGADTRTIKRAYFGLSKEFHPDRYFRLRVGDFGPRLDTIFKRVVLAYELLSDPTTRAEIERSMAHLPPPDSQPEAAPEEAGPSDSESAPEPTAQMRKRNALERLRRQFRIPEEILVERRTKAREFSQSARVAMHRAAWLEAAASARLAIAFDPWNDEYKCFFAEIQARVHEVRAEGLLNQADASWDSNSQQEALRLYEEVLAYRPADAEINVRAATLCLALDQLDQAQEYAENACAVRPDVSDNHYLLGRILRKAGLRERAREALERVLEIDPGRDEIKKEIQALRRSGRRPGGGSQ